MQKRHRKKKFPKIRQKMRRRIRSFNKHRCATPCLNFRAAKSNSDLTLPLNAKANFARRTMSSSSPSSVASSSSFSVSSTQSEFVENESLLDLVPLDTDPDADRLLGLKAFMIWGFLTAAGWIYISPEWLPLFSVLIVVVWNIRALFHD
jgi:hypothetical protein